MKSAAPLFFLEAKVTNAPIKKLKHPAIIAHSIINEEFKKPNTEPVTSVRLFTVSTGASILRCFLYVSSSLQSLSGLARHVGFGKLKNLSNQVSVCFFGPERQCGLPYGFNVGIYCTMKAHQLIKEGCCYGFP